MLLPNVKQMRFVFSTLLAGIAFAMPASRAQAADSWSDAYDKCANNYHSLYTWLQCLNSEYSTVDRYPHEEDKWIGCWDHIRDTDPRFVPTAHVRDFKDHFILCFGFSDWSCDVPGSAPEAGHYHPQCDTDNGDNKKEAEKQPPVSRPPGGGSRPPAPSPAALHGFLENPGPGSYQSGIGVISGWVCDAEEVEIEMRPEGGGRARYEAAYGTERRDTAHECRDTDNGFSLPINWNLLGDGIHTVAALADGRELGRARVIVTTLGQEFLRDVSGTCTVEDFPRAGESVAVVWQESSQNFVLAGEVAPRGDEASVSPTLVGFLENPKPNSFQSGLGMITGWVCEADTVEIVIEAENGEVVRYDAAWGTERSDTGHECRDVDNGFGLLVNWNLLGDGEHTVIALVDGEELARATIRVTTFGEEFVRGGTYACEVPNFPTDGERTLLEWQESQQNFVIVGVK